MLGRLLRTFSWQENSHHPWRNLAAVVAVMMGVALAFAVHLINASALSEFSSALRTANGQTDLSLQASSAWMDENLYARIANQPGADQASPVLEVSTYALDASGNKKPLKIIGIDALVMAGTNPGLMPILSQDAAIDRLRIFSPTVVFLNASALNLRSVDGKHLNVLLSTSAATLSVAGTVAASGAALAVMDIGALQDLFGLQGQISRIDLRLNPGIDSTAWVASLQLPAQVQAQLPGDSSERVGNLSRAYRVNMTVLALVALFTGAFLVFSVLSLSVAKRSRQFALLGVLGLTARDRLNLVLAEAALLGSVGSFAGIALGTALAGLALSLLGGDLGGGYFSGVAPLLQWSGLAAALYGALGVAAALAGAWWPARAASRLPLAQGLKGLGNWTPPGQGHWVALFCIAAYAVLSLLPAIFGIPIAAYAAIALLLVGGIGLLPWLVDIALKHLVPWAAQRALPLLALERARRSRNSAAIAIGGVVAALSLAVALTVMVASFRQSVMQWLDTALPAPLYVRMANNVSAGQVLGFTSDQVQAIAALPGVARVQGQRVQSLQLSATLPAVSLVARQTGDAGKDLPLLIGPTPAAADVPAHALPIYVSEAMVDLYSAVPGQIFPLKLPKTHIKYAQNAPNNIANTESPVFYVAGVWRDYARQFGTIAIDQTSYARLSGDTLLNDLALWPQADASGTDIQTAIRRIQPLAEFGSASEIRALSLRIFDRSFAVTYWLQAVAIAIGLFGVAASFSAQVLARRKEFGLLTHLGLGKKQILSVVATEGAVWTAIGSVAGCALGLAVAHVLVHVVNPQSFHWTMDLHIPWLRLAALCVAVVVAGTATAWLAGRAAVAKDAVMAVKEDW